MVVLPRGEGRRLGASRLRTVLLPLQDLMFGSEYNVFIQNRLTLNTLKS